jgi:hypothetical protein
LSSESIKKFFSSVFIWGENKKLFPSMKTKVESLWWSMQISGQYDSSGWYAADRSQMADAVTDWNAESYMGPWNDFHSSSLATPTSERYLHPENIRYIQLATGVVVSRLFDCRRRILINLEADEQNQIVQVLRENPLWWYEPDGCRRLTNEIIGRLSQQVYYQMKERDRYTMFALNWEALRPWDPPRVRSEHTTRGETVYDLSERTFHIACSPAIQAYDQEYLAYSLKNRLLPQQGLGRSNWMNRVPKECL